MPANVVAVTGFVPLGLRNVSNDKFRALGADLVQAIADGGALVHEFDNFPLHECWMFKWLFEHDKLGIQPARPVASDRFTSAFHKVQSDSVMHQKMEWTRMALDATAEPLADVYVWIDYGILKQPQMTKEVVTRFFQKVIANPPTDNILAPGLRDPETTDHEFSWERFAGMYIVPAAYVRQMTDKMRDEALAMIRETDRLWFETDALVHLERRGELPVQQYKSWWGASMIENYPAVP